MQYIRFQNGLVISLDYGAGAKIYHQSHGGDIEHFFPGILREACFRFCNKICIYEKPLIKFRNNDLPEEGTGMIPERAIPSPS